MLKIQTASFSHIGTRDEQQDSVGMWANDHAQLIVVADGVGGNVGGAAASQAAIKSAHDYWEKQDGLFLVPEDNLTTIAQQAHEAIRKLHPNEKKTPSSTLVILYLDTDKEQAHWVHMGDSRLYRINAGKTTTRTRDHSIVQLLLEQGEITEDELNSHPDKGRILKSLGASEFKGVDYDICDYLPGDTFLLCSDGYWESLGPKDTPLPSKAPNITLEEYTEKLVVAAVKRNGKKSDNTTAAIATISDRDNNPALQHSSSNRGQRIFYIILAVLALIDIAIIIWHLLI
jgi:serine/threonine protein phosphatase PrpC